MSETPEIHQLARQVAILEERMATKQAEYRSDLADLMREIADRNAEHARIQADAADRMAASVERMASSRWWQTAVMIAVIALVGTAVAGIPTLPAILEALQR